MKRRALILLLTIGLLSTSLYSCREKSAVEEVVDDVEDAVD